MQSNNSIYCVALLFGRIESDGRVQRILNSLSQNYKITLICIGESQDFDLCLAYNVKRVNHHSKYFLHFVLLLKFLKEVELIKPKFVIAHDFFTSFSCYLAKLVYRVKLIADSHELIIPHALGLYNLRERIWFNLDRIALINADLVLCASDLRAEIMRWYYKLSVRPLVIENIDTYEEKTVTIKDKNKIKVVYQGYIAKERSIFKILNVIKHTSYPIEIDIYGNGPDAEKLKNVILPEIRKHITVHYHGSVTRDYLHKHLKEYDIGLICYSYVGLNNNFCASNKIYEYLTNGLIVFSTGQPPLAEIVDNFNIGETISEHLNGDEILSKFEHLCENMSEKKNNIKIALNAMQINNRMTNQYENLIKSINNLFG